MLWQKVYQLIIAGLCSASMLFLQEHVPLSALVFVYGGVMMQVGQMAHNSSFIKLEEGTEVCYIMKVLLLLF